MIPYQVNDTDRLEAPSCWEETTTRAFQRLKRDVKKGDNAVKIFAALTGTKFEDVWDAAREDLDAAIYQAVAFVGNQPQDFKQAPRPKTFTLAGATVLVPERIHKLTVGQNFMLRDELAKAETEKRSLETLLSIAVAVYLQPLVDQAPFDPERARELDEQIQDMPIGDVWPLGFFLLHRLITYGRFGTVSWFLLRLQSLRSRLQWPKRLRWRSWNPFTPSARSINTRPVTDSSRGSSSRNRSTNSSPSSSSGPSREPTTNGSK